MSFHKQQSYFCFKKGQNNNVFFMKNSKNTNIIFGFSFIYVFSFSLSMFIRQIEHRMQVVQSPLCFEFMNNMHFEDLKCCWKHFNKETPVKWMVNTNKYKYLGKFLIFDIILHEAKMTSKMAASKMHLFIFNLKYLVETLTL